MCSWSPGTSSSGTIALTGHSGMQTAQSMHSSGSIVRKFGPSRKQSTGQTSTQSVYLQRMQDSVTTWVIGHDPAKKTVMPMILPQRVNSGFDAKAGPWIYHIASAGPGGGPGHRAGRVASWRSKGREPDWIAGIGRAGTGSGAERDANSGGGPARARGRDAAHLRGPAAGPGARP